MNTVTIGIDTGEVSKERLAAAFRGEPQGARISFSSADLIWKVLTAKRWEIISAMTGQGPLAIREVARRVTRDVKAVHGDVQALLIAGVLNHTPKGVEFPFDAIRVDFTLTKAA